MLLFLWVWRDNHPFRTLYTLHDVLWRHVQSVQWQAYYTHFPVSPLTPRNHPFPASGYPLKSGQNNRACLKKYRLLYGHYPLGRLRTLSFQALFLSVFGYPPGPRLPVPVFAQTFFCSPYWSRLHHFSFVLMRVFLCLSGPRLKPEKVFRAGPAW